MFAPVQSVPADMYRPAWRQPGPFHHWWLSDLSPALDEMIEVNSLDIEHKKSYYFEALARCDSNGKIGIVFSGNKNSALYLDAKEEIIQISNINWQCYAINISIFCMYGVLI